MNRVKIVCTIGPKTASESMLLELYKNGMSVARLNGSHANLDWHQQAIHLIQKVLPNIPILLDIPGRKIRTGLLINEPEFSVNDVIILTTDDQYIGEKKSIVNYASLHEDVSIGDVIMADDGTLKFTVSRIEGKDIFCIANTSGKLRSRKGINVPFVKLNTPEVTSRDRKMIDFACENRVDFIGLSFVESASHVLKFKELINSRGPRIVAKVENQKGMDEVTAIASMADVIMIDRGDLSVETSLYDVALRQKEIIRASKVTGTPVIVATEMLHSMTHNPFPTKAELTDISNAVLDGASCTMLSGETAVGLFPIESVQTMRLVISETEKYQADNCKNMRLGSSLKSIPKAITDIIPMLCKSSPIDKVIAITRSGYAARMLSQHSLTQQIIAVSDDAFAAKSFGILAGVTGIHYKLAFAKKGVDHFSNIILMLLEMRLLVPQDTILITGVIYPQPGSRMNAVNILRVEDLIRLFDWKL